MSDSDRAQDFYATKYREAQQTIQRLQQDNREMRETLTYISDQNSGIWGMRAFNTLRKVNRK